MSIELKLDKFYVSKTAIVRARKASSKYLIFISFIIDILYEVMSVLIIC